jgi:glycosyltransferase involved in cell wall biosynthesis
MKVSVLVITYNNERFITEAIDSIVTQKVNFDYEIIIGEDCSTDRTREIVIDFRDRYPDKIHLLLNEKNVGGRRNFIQILKVSRGDYIAILEGDDYWTSPNKLQKQVDFLDNHPDFTICFHSAGWLDQESGEIKSWKYGPPVIKPYYTIDDLLEHSNFIPTCSVMFRNNLLGEFPKWFWEAGIGDFPLHILNAQHGKIGYIDEAMSVYRVHGAGIRSGSSPTVRLERLIDTYDLVNYR